MAIFDRSLFSRFPFYLGLVPLGWRGVIPWTKLCASKMSYVAFVIFWCNRRKMSLLPKTRPDAPFIVAECWPDIDRELTHYLSSLAAPKRHFEGKEIKNK
jgi:hypothetical protein